MATFRFPDLPLFKFSDGLLEGQIKGEAKGRAEGLAEGKAEGLAEGEAKGKAEGRAEIARAMLAKGMSVELIAEVSGLSTAEINELKLPVLA